MSSGFMIAMTVSMFTTPWMLGRFGYRSIFFMVVPFCIASIWLAYKFGPVSAPGGADIDRESTIDWAGLVLAATGTVCLLNGLVDLRGGSLTTACASAINFIRTLGGAAGISLCAVVLEWRLAAHGDVLTNPQTSPARLAAFHEAFWMLAVVSAIAVVAAWQLRAPQPQARPAPQ